MYLEAKGYGSHLWNILFVSQMTEGGLKKKKAYLHFQNAICQMTLYL